MTDSYSSVILGLKSAHDHMPWYEKLFFPYQLASELENYSKNRTAENELKIFKAFEKNTWFFQRWFFSSLQRFHHNSYTEAVRTLNKEGLLEGDTGQVYFNAVVAHENPSDVAQAIVTLDKSGLLEGDTGQVNFNAVVTHKFPSNVVQAIVTLNKSGFLTSDKAQAYFNAVVRHQAPHSAALAFDALNKVGLLTDDNFKTVEIAWKPEVARAIVVLNEVNFLTGHSAQTYIDAVATNHYPMSVARAIVVLNEAGLLTSDNFNAVVTHQKSNSLFNALHILKESGFLTGDKAQAYFKVVVTYHAPEIAASAFNKLNKAGLLTDNNFKAVVEHEYPSGILRALDILLERKGLLTGTTTQIYFNAVVNAVGTPEDVACTIDNLKVTDLLTGDAAQININAVSSHQHSSGLISAVGTLHRAGFLTGNAAQVYFNAVVKHQAPYAVADALYAANLHNKDLFTGNAAQTNIDAVAAHQDLPGLTQIFRTLQESKPELLKGDAAQTNFNTLVTTKTDILFHGSKIGIWKIMPARPTTAEFQAMIAIAKCHADNPMRGDIALSDYVRANTLRNQPVATTYNLVLPTTPKKASSVANNPNTLFHLDKNSDLKDTSSGMAFNPKN